MAKKISAQIFFAPNSIILLKLGSMADTLQQLCHQELMNDISSPLEKILKEASGDGFLDICERIFRSLEWNQHIHHSRTSYVNFVKNRLFEKDNSFRCHWNFLSLAAALLEAIIHDIDNRLDSHEFTELDACFVQAYAPLLYQKAIMEFAKQSTGVWLMSDIFLKRITGGLIQEQFRFLNNIKNIPLLEKKIETGRSHFVHEDLWSLLELRAQQIVISAAVIFYPYLILRKINKDFYRRLICYFVKIFIADGLLKDISEIEPDEKSSRFNAWSVFRNYPGKFKQLYIARIKQTLTQINEFDEIRFENLKEFNRSFHEKRDKLFDAIGRIE